MTWMNAILPRLSLTWITTFPSGPDKHANSICTHRRAHWPPISKHRHDTSGAIDALPRGSSAGWLTAFCLITACSVYRSAVNRPIIIIFIIIITSLLRIKQHTTYENLLKLDGGHSIETRVQTHAGHWIAFNWNIFALCDLLPFDLIFNR